MNPSAEAGGANATGASGAAVAGGTGPQQAAATYAYIGALMDELARAGVQHVCACPGSRSTPLVVCAHRHPGLKLWMHVDERAASFFALGMARALRVPVAILCTSGTAAANFLPAMVEARHSGIPLIALTADRPPELRDWGAPQTIDQVRIYGGVPRWFVDLALPEDRPAMIRYVRATARRAAAEAWGPPAGPVHINVPLREPLVPGNRLPVVDSTGITSTGPATGLGAAAKPVPDRTAVDELAAVLWGTGRGLIICGPQDDPGLAGPLTDLAAALGYPLLADPLSCLRCGPHHQDVIIDAYDAFLRQEAAAAGLTPQVVLRLGAVPTSKALMAFLDHHHDALQLLVRGGDAWHDPAHRAVPVIHANPRELCRALLGAVEAQMPRPAPSTVSSPGNSPVSGRDPSDWLTRWRRLNTLSRSAVRRAVDAMAEPFEGAIFADLADLLPEDGLIFAGNSMPVRDLDAFCPGSRRRVRFLANRGANGIDGVISTALGVAAVDPGPVVLVVGDLSFYHDLNGLLAARQHGISATIVLVNNDGGGIFSFLPQSRYEDWFEPLMAVPHGLDFRPAADLFGTGWQRADNRRAFRAALAESLGAPGLQIIEAVTDRHRNKVLHDQVWQAVAGAIG